MTQMEPRQSESSRRDLRGIFPGIFTMGNLVCGFIAIISVSQGGDGILVGCRFILLAAFLDILDGKVARLAGVNSDFGVELDSLADFTSFGIAPAFLVYAVKLKGMGQWGWIIGVVFIMAASYRLARYNLLAQSDEKRNFLGLPVPAAALGLVTYVIFSYEIWGTLEYAEYLVGMVILFSALMVSQVEYDVFPDRPSRADLPKIGLLILATIGAFLNYRLVLFPLLAIYILHGLTREGYRLYDKAVGLVVRTKNNGDE